MAGCAVRAATNFLCAAALAMAAAPAAAAAAAAESPAATRAAHRPAVRAARPPGPRRASAAPRGALGRRLSPAAAGQAAQSCARYAVAAGWANNGSTGRLVTASAICVAESGGQPTVYYCGQTGRDGYYPPVNCAGYYDRGLWQLDSQAQAGISDQCAFTARCNADAAYAVSQRGRSFAPWATYTSGFYANYLADVQAAVAALRRGTVASAVLGICLARSRYAVDAAVITRSCGVPRQKEQWLVSADAIREGSLCLAVASAAATATVHLRRCNGLRWQQWAAQGNGELRNALAGYCLRDPGGSVVPGTQLTVAPCLPIRARMWWLP